eukprot:Blabericola_migrator_1__6374@NODE_3212_length_1947_cov_12_673404_g2010_i0_p1_GENE_NODE_3212_length_1947_cov_12_673404_g2010_i0NODE_3212_length_1947_cov_12_673404_g2010_i0_p1_ORF_typecomplete_len119_score9_20_NODE_3212_length_1947_cov_12_673404_g2010_i0316672
MTPNVLQSLKLGSELLDAELEPPNCIAVLEDVSVLLFPLIHFYSQLLSLSSMPMLFGTWANEKIALFALVANATKQRQSGSEKRHGRQTRCTAHVLNLIGRTARHPSRFRASPQILIL